MNINDIENLVIFYFVTFILCVAIYKLYKLLKVKLVITKKKICYTFNNSKWVELNIDEIHCVYHEGSRIDAKVNNKLVEIPPFGFNMEMKLLGAFKEIGIEVVSYSCD